MRWFLVGVVGLLFWSRVSPPPSPSVASTSTPQSISPSSSSFSFQSSSSPSQSLETVRGSIAKISTGKGKGSGVLISKDQVLTNWHVIRAVGEGGQVDLIFPSGESHKASILRSDKKMDIALLQLESPSSLSPVEFDQGTETGEKVFAIGYPFGKDQVSNSGRYLESDPMGLRIIAEVELKPGMSGGGLVNQEGQLVGLNKAILEGNGKRGKAGDGLFVGIHGIELFLGQKD